MKLELDLAIDFVLYMALQALGFLRQPVPVLPTRNSNTGQVVQHNTSSNEPAQVRKLALKWY